MSGGRRGKGTARHNEHTTEGNTWTVWRAGRERRRNAGEETKQSGEGGEGGTEATKRHSGRGRGRRITPGTHTEAVVGDRRERRGRAEGMCRHGEDGGPGRGRGRC